MNTKTIILAATVAVLASGIGYGLGRHHSDPAAATASAPTDGKRVLYWYDPMAPEQHFDKPGRSPTMDMALVPRYVDDDAGAGLAIDPARTQSLGMRIAKVERGTLDDSVSAVATVQFNDRDVAVLQARAAGFVRKVYARATGDVVAQGAPLADVLVPDWAGAQAEFLAVLGTGDKPLAAAARQRLLLMGMPDTLVDEVAATGKVQSVLTLTAPISGVIQELGVRSGMALAQGATIARINGLGTVWLEAAVPEALAGPLRVGQSAKVTFDAFPGRSATGMVIAVLPQLDAANRTLRVRVELANDGAALKPGMFAQVRLATGSGKPLLLVPSEAVIRTGTRDLVMVSSGSGRYVPVAVRLGPEGGGRTVILAGLDEGDRVVASGQFLIDSEASLRGISPTAAPEIAAPTPDDPPPAGAKPSGSAAPTPAKAAAAAPTAPPATAPILHRGIGTIKRIDGKSVVISHGPIDSIGWGAMTMPFQLATPELARRLKPGDTVEFGFVEESGEYVVRMLRKTGGAP